MQIVQIAKWESLPIAKLHHERESAYRNIFYVFKDSIFLSGSR